MDYEKKYRDLVEAVKELQETNPSDDGIQKWVRDNVPELNESESERTRKEIINYFQCQSQDEPSRKGIHNKWIAWLEKQGKQKPTDKVEPKFNVGDIIKHNKANIICKVLYANVGFYRLINILGGDEIELSDVEKNFHLWTIKDAKDGDVLAAGFNIIICKSPTDYDTRSYCRLASNSFIDKEESGWDSTLFYPATKEQREALERAISDAGYEWDANEKKLKKIEQEYHCTGVREPKEATGVLKQLLNKENYAWSEEDEAYRVDILVKLEPHITDDNFTDVQNWFKSIKDRVQTLSKQEWSEEDIEMINWLIRCCEKEHEELCNDRYGHQEIVSDLKRDCRKKWDWLESLKNKVVPQNTWKPSDEQMDALETAISSLQSTALESLYYDLKKLKE